MDEPNRRHEPRVTAQQMGYYIDAQRAGKREKIVRNQMFPPPVPTRRYTGASDVVRSAFVKGGDILQHLNDGARRLSHKPCRTPREEESKGLCLQAIEHFTKALPDLPLKGVTASFIGRSQPLGLLIEGVKVSVYPIVLLTKRVRSEERRGALLLSIYKTEPLSDHGGEAVATLVYEALAASRLGSGPAVIDPKLCLVVDVFRQRVYTAPAGRTRIMGEIKSNCREFARTWREIQRAA